MLTNRIFHAVYTAGITWGVKTTYVWKTEDIPIIRPIELEKLRYIIKCTAPMTVFQYNLKVLGGMLPPAVYENMDLERETSKYQWIYILD